MCSGVYSFMGLQTSTEEMGLALVVPGGVETLFVPVSNEEGTFLALSDNPRARVVAALTGFHEMSLERGYARTW